MSCQACQVKDPSPHRDIAIVQGEEFAWPLAITDKSTGLPIDSTWSAAADIRASLSDATTVGSFTAAIDAQGVLTLSIPSATSLAWSWSTGVYDIFVTDPDGGRWKVVHGCVGLIPAVTRG